MDSFLQTASQVYRIKKLCMENEEELLEYELLRNKAMEGTISLLSEPERIFDAKNGKLFIVIEWLE